MSPEAFLESKAVAHAKKMGGWTGKWVSPGHNGVMDRIFSHWMCGPFFVEFKAPGKPQTVLQRAMAETLSSHGFRVYAPVDSLVTIKMIIDDEFGGNPISRFRHKPWGYK